MWLLFCLLLLLLLLLPLLLLLLFFARADGDFTLMSKGRTPTSAVEDKVVWITGASQGIGEALAKEYACLGAKLILSSRRPFELERVKSELVGKHCPNGVVVLPLDIASDVTELKEAVMKAETAFVGAGVDVMVHNAASQRPNRPALEISDDMLKDNFEVNVLGPIRLTQLLLPRMLQRGKGEFLVVSSVAGIVPAPGQSLYAATKHAVNGYFHTLRSEVNQQGIKVTVVCPGPTNTSTLASPNPELISATRCAELILKAAAHGMREAWICRQPLLVFLYLMQYLPGIGFALADRVGPKRLKIDRQGSLSSLLLKKSN
ncbi:unnamed protein product [Sphagnum compactum]